ncbi:MAG: hypothetical protein Kow0092_27800 [Deferrisomatales bacterium]
MADRPRPRAAGAAPPEPGPMGARSRGRKLLHVAFWTALFYGLAVLVAKVAEWASGR